MKKIIAFALALVMCLGCIAGCGESKETTLTPVDTMAKALLEVQSGTAEAAVVDSVMAEAMVGEGSDYKDLMIIDGICLAEEEYGIGFRNGSTAVEAINGAIEALIANGTLAEIAEKYALSVSLIDNFKPSSEEGVTLDKEADDWKYIKDKGKLIIGITEYAPMNYYDTDGKTLIGFDTEFAEAVCKELDIEAEFIVINWDTKEIELEAKNIDCIWNGVTVDADRWAQMDFSGSYMFNKQILVINSKDADKYTDLESLKGASFVAEEGSAGEKTINALIEDGTF